MPNASMQGSLALLGHDPVAARVLAALQPAAIGRVARDLAGADPFGEQARLGAALAAVEGGGPGGDAARVLEHQLWCAWRQARWRTLPRVQELPLRIVGARHLAETAGRPTILIAPMTLCTRDAVAATRRLLGPRPHMFFGEGVGTGDLGPGAVAAGDGVPAVRRIHALLRGGGVLCTYADFAYDAHAARAMRLFGRPRPVASGLLSLAVRLGAMLLPVVTVRVGKGLEAHLDEPLRLEGDGGALRGRAKDDAMAAVAHAIGESLELLIRRAPHQWLLLPTLTFDSPQMARPAAVSAGWPSGTSPARDTPAARSGR